LAEGRAEGNAKFSRGGDSDESGISWTNPLFP
jgi:hypothetical protein